MNPGVPIWSALSLDDHEFQYNPQKAFPNFADNRLLLQPHNDAAGRSLAVERDVAYGDHPQRRLDIYRPRRHAGPTPVHIFLHGGYWRAQDKANFAFVAGTLVPLGITTMIANYELCPSSTLDEVVESAIDAFAWICANVVEIGGAADQITLSGHSAGAHLGAEIIAHDWAGHGPIQLAGALLTSGIYNPLPAMRTSVNADLRLDVDLARRHDMESKAPRMRGPITLLAGANEPWQWVDQSFRYFQTLRRHDYTPSLHVLPDYGHFDILNDYLMPDSVTIRAIRRHVGIGSDGDGSRISLAGY